MSTSSALHPQQQNGASVNRRPPPPHPPSSSSLSVSSAALAHQLRVTSMTPSPSSASSFNFSPSSSSPQSSSSSYRFDTPSPSSSSSSTAATTLPRSSSQPTTPRTNGLHASSFATSLVSPSASDALAAASRLSEPRLRNHASSTPSTSTPSSFSNHVLNEFDEEYENDKYDKHRRRDDNISFSSSSSAPSSSSSASKISLITVVGVVLVLCCFMLSFSIYWFSADRSLLPTSMRKMLFASRRYRPYDPSLFTVIRDPASTLVVEEEELAIVCGDSARGTMIEGIICPGPLQKRRKKSKEASEVSPDDDDEEEDDDQRDSLSTVSSSVLTLEDITIFTVLVPEPEDKPVFNRRGKQIKPTAPHDSNSWLRAIFSWSQRVASPSQIMVLVRKVEDCVLLKDLPFDVFCRVASVCWKEETAISSSVAALQDAPELRCILEEANRRADTEIMIFVEDHIILFKDFMPALLKVASHLDYFFAAGSSSPLSLTVDSLLPLSDWQKDVEAAIFYDSSVGRSSFSASGRSGRGEAEHQKHSDVAHEHSLHYFAYRRTTMNLAGLDSDVVMGGSAFYGHQWEKLLVAHLLLQDNLTLVDLTDSVTAIELTHRDFSNVTSVLNSYNNQKIQENSHSYLKPMMMNVSTSASTLKDREPNLSPYYTQSNINSDGEILGDDEEGNLLSSGPIPIIPMNLGRLENSHLVLTGKCPTCSLKENREADLPLILIRHANAFGQIIVLTVNSDYLSLAFNWICRARAIKMNNYVMLAEDRVAYRILRKMNIPVVLRKDAPYKKLAAITGSAEFQETLYLRALFFKDVVSLGFDLILSHLDTIWFETSAPLFEKSRDDCDMWVQVEGGTKAGGGLMYVRATPIGLQFVKDYLVCEKENFEFITTHGKSRFSYSDDPGMNCVDLISQRLVRRNHLIRCTLDSSRYVSETAFFDQQLSQYQAIYPAFVHLNRQENVSTKARAFLDWDLWQVDDLAMVKISTLREAHHHTNIQCKALPPPLPLPTFSASSTLHIIINLLVSYEHFALSQTLEHLAAADYTSSAPSTSSSSFSSSPSSTPHQTTQVDLRIYIQVPEHESISNNKQYMRVISLVSDFEWKYGLKTVIYINEYVGVSDKWLDYWFYNGVSSSPSPSSDLSAESSKSSSSSSSTFDGNENVFQIALVAGQILSPEWLVWSKKALLNYYYHPYQYDAHLMGIHLAHQFTIIGESPLRRYGSRLPSTVLNATRQTLYHYQLVPLLGTIFFPHHLQTFLHWYSLQNHTSSSGKASNRACVPTLITNGWYLQEPVKYWWVWLNRFSFETGWYLLYTNFISSIDHQPRALLVDETPLAGQLTVSLIKTLTSKEATMIPYPQILLYDLHFNPVISEEEEADAYHGRGSDLRGSQREEGAVMIGGGHRVPHLALRKTMFPPLPSPRRTESSVISDLKARQAALEYERAQWNRERGGGGKERAEEEDIAESRGLWQRVANERQSLDIARLIVDIQADEKEALSQEARFEQEHHDKQLNAYQHSPFVTTTDLVIDLMKMVMTEVDDGNELANDDALTSPASSSSYTSQIAETQTENQRYKDAVRVIRAKIKHVRAGEQHLHQHVRGSQRDRCFVVGDTNPLDLVPTDSSSSSATLADPSASLPYPFNASLSITELYAYIYRTNMDRLAAFPSAPANSSARFIIYRPKVPVPFDRHLRDLPDFEAMYDCPFPSTKWSYSAFSKYFAKEEEAAPEENKKKHLIILEDLVESKLKESLRTKLFDAIFPQAALLHTDAVSHDRLLFTNVQYKPYALSLFSTPSRMRRVGVLMKTLQAKPKNALIAAGKELYASLGLHAVKYSLCVHVVAPPAKLVKYGNNETIAASLPGVEVGHWQCVASQLLSLGFKYEDAVIFFTTNSPYISAISIAEAEIGRYGRVTFNKQVFDSSQTNYGISNSTVLTNTQHDPLSSALKYDPYVLGHFILGDCDISISSGTTYGIFGAARKGFAKRAFLYKAKPEPIKTKDGKIIISDEQEYCGPMHRIDYPPDNDLHF